MMANTTVETVALRQAERQGSRLHRVNGTNFLLAKTHGFRGVAFDLDPTGSLRKRWNDFGECTWKGPLLPHKADASTRSPMARTSPPPDFNMQKLAPRNW